MEAFRLSYSYWSVAWIIWLSSFLLLFPVSDARAGSGDFQLSGLNTETVIGSFAITAHKMGHVKITLTSNDPYANNKDLYIRLYKDDQWTNYQKAPSCTDKAPFSMTNEQIAMVKKHRKYEKETALQLDNTKGDRSHYFYFVITDCSLEFYMHDNQIPQVHFEIEAWNDGSHVSADEDHLTMLHTITLMVSGILAIFMSMAIGIQLYEKSSVHAAMFWVATAAALDSLSSLFELIHLSMYSSNGIGSYALDACSAHLEALCDALLALLLMSVGAGWTLPSDVVRVQQNASPVQKLLGGLQSPFGALKKAGPTAFLAIFIVLSHVLLAQWGRIYNDDFDSYHDLEHLPGKLLMTFRIVFGICMLVCCFQTRNRCPVSLQTFYVKLAVVGSFWFQSLPFLTWFVNRFVAFHLRHRAVGIWAATAQTCAIVLTSWLVTSHSTSYHKLSHLSSTKDNLTDSLSSVGALASEPRTWTMGKAKVRLD